MQFGGLTQAREAHHDVYAARPVEDFFADARYTLRTMRRTPALAGAAILTLALGVGANTAIFSAVNAVILRPLPFPQPDQLYMLWEENPEKGWYKQVAAPANMLDWREQVGAFADVMGYTDLFGTCDAVGRRRADASSRRVRDRQLLLGARRPRGVRPDVHGCRDVENRPERGGAVRIGLWRDRFGSDPRVVGRTIELDGTSVQVVGRHAGRLRSSRTRRSIFGSRGAGPQPAASRFRSGARIGSASSRASSPACHGASANVSCRPSSKRLQRDYPATNKLMGAGMTPLHEFLVGDTRTAATRSARRSRAAAAHRLRERREPDAREGVGARA